MCLAVPMKVVAIKDNNTAVVRSRGMEKEVFLDIVDRMPSLEDFVIVHAGFAIHTVTPEEARESLRLFEEMSKEVNSREGSQGLGA